MTDAEIDNAGDISAMFCAIRDLSHDVNTITNDQMSQLIEIFDELKSLILDITRREL